MILFDTFTPVDGSPIYLQIVTFIKRGAIAGSIRDGDELPSRRVLSALLGINRNTVQKAFRLLEEEQLIESRTGARSCMTLDEEKLRGLKKDMLAQDIRGVIEALKQMGISKQDALQLIDENWEDLL